MARRGRSLAVSADGTTVAVGAMLESSAAANINGNQADNTAPYAGAAYVFKNSGAGWAQEAYVKASNPETYDKFSSSLALSGNGNLLVSGSPDEASSSTGIDGVQWDNSAGGRGAVYVWRRTGSTWGL